MVSGFWGNTKKPQGLILFNLGTAEKKGCFFLGSLPYQHSQIFCHTPALKAPFHHNLNIGEGKTGNENIELYTIPLSFQDFRFHQKQPYLRWNCNPSPIHCNYIQENLFTSFPCVNNCSLCKISMYESHQCSRTASCTFRKWVSCQTSVLFR